MGNRSGGNKNATEVKVEMMRESIKEMKNDMRENAAASSVEHTEMGKRIGKVEIVTTEMKVTLKHIVWLITGFGSMMLGSLHFEKIAWLFGG